MSSQFNDTDDDVTLHTRRSSDATYRGDERRAADLDDARQPEREVTLNTGIVLGLFFGLALLCAVFFGFGYSMGRKSVPPVVASDGDNSTPAETSATTTPKPSPAVASSQPVPEYVPPTGSDRTPAAVPAPKPAGPATAEKPTTVVVKDSPGTPTSKPTVIAAAPVVRVAPAATTSTSAPMPSITAGGTLYVQIAAVSHQEDADVLLSALRRRGYTVLTRSDPNDKLLHVQTGPFGTRKEADAMRLKLAADGYNAFIK